MKHNANRIKKALPALIGAGLLFLSGCCFPLFNPPGKMSTVIHQDNFSGDLSNWVVEQQPGGSVFTESNHLVIADEGGCSVWFREPLDAPVVITYTVRASSKARVSDINCFWMASEPQSPEDFFAEGHGRTGAFATYDTMNTYYVGYGGNYNSTTRFRRYAGDGKRPLLPEHDLGDPAFMIEPDRDYAIRLVAAGGRAQFYCNDDLIFDYTDPEPLTRGWFAFRTVLSRLEISDFKVWKLLSHQVPSVLHGRWD